MWTKYFPPVPSPSLFSSADQLFFSNKQSKTNKGQNINRRFRLFTWSSSKYLSHIQNLYLGMFLCISLHKKPLSMHQQVTRVMYTAARQRIMFETDKWGKTLSIPLVRAHLHPVRQSTYDQGKYENIIKVWGCVVKTLLAKVEAMGNCTYCKERINSLQGNNIFSYFLDFHLSRSGIFNIGTAPQRVFQENDKSSRPTWWPWRVSPFPRSWKVITDLLLKF